ncbi:hypothetical protein N7452_004788 [Penicillium brevicompactum]|uniref:Nicotinamide N-methyltransferase n=1 Tax=Penicillium brevicompactum TaxID=5074 RepID=A0A9W9UFX6_PENBR|nr:hypothetical protein N7452_004788 [Penicillium brevicompactum]
MLHSRLRPLPRRNAVPSAPSAPTPEFENEDLELDESPEDLFSAFIAHFYPGSGNPSEETVAPQPKGDESINQVDAGRKLFAHFLWSAGMVVAEGVEMADEPGSEGTEARDIWAVEGESVLELGAGAALPSVVCALAKASKVVITDHPSSPAFCGAIAHNIEYNLSRTPAKGNISMQPHEWGVLDDAFSTQHKGTFSRIIAADCFWMRSQHENIARTMQWFLSPGGKVWVVAGFHTGRATVAGFFNTALDNGFVIERIFERDLVGKLEDGSEIRRDWVPSREGEGVENKTRWCVVAVLKRKEE